MRTAPLQGDAVLLGQQRRESGREACKKPGQGKLGPHPMVVVTCHNGSDVFVALRVALLVLQRNCKNVKLPSHGVLKRANVCLPHRKNLGYSLTGVEDDTVGGSGCEGTVAWVEKVLHRLIKLSPTWLAAYAGSDRTVGCSSSRLLSCTLRLLRCGLTSHVNHRNAEAS